MNNTTSKITPFELYNGITDANIKPGPKVVLLTLARFINWKRGDYRVWPSTKTIGKKANMYRTTVGKHLNTLDRLGLIEVTGVTKNDVIEFDIKVEQFCTPVAKRDNPLSRITTTPVAKRDIKENKKEIDVAKKVERTTYGTTPSASASEHPKQTQDSGIEKTLDQLKASYGRNWGTSRPARLAVFCQLGRNHFPGNPYFDSKKKFRPYQLDTLDHWADVLGKYFADVLDYTFEVWPKDGTRKTPTLVALGYHSAKTMYDLWNEKQTRFNHAAMLRRVKANLQASEQEAA